MSHTFSQLLYHEGRTGESEETPEAVLSPLLQHTRRLKKHYGWFRRLPGALRRPSGTLLKRCGMLHGGGGILR